MCAWFVCSLSRAPEFTTHNREALLHGVQALLSVRPGLICTQELCGVETRASLCRVGGRVCLCAFPCGPAPSRPIVNRGLGLPAESFTAHRRQTDVVCPMPALRMHSFIVMLSGHLLAACMIRAFSETTACVGSWGGIAWAACQHAGWPPSQHGSSRMPRLCVSSMCTRGFRQPCGAHVWSAVFGQD